MTSNFYYKKANMLILSNRPVLLRPSMMIYWSNVILLTLFDISLQVLVEMHITALSSPGLVGLALSAQGLVGGKVVTETIINTHATI